MSDSYEKILDKYKQSIKTGEEEEKGNSNVLDEQEINNQKDTNIQPNELQTKVTSEDEQQQWLNWFEGLGENLEQKFAIWESLNEEHNLLKSYLESGNFNRIDLSAAQDQLDKTADKLDYKNPYRVVVVGESGAGKSTTINALLKKELLISDVAKAITGAATYVYPNCEDIDSPVVKIFTRDDNDFQRLLIRLFETESELSLLDILNEIKPDTILEQLEQPQSQLYVKLETRITDTQKRDRLKQEIKDIVTVWQKLNQGELKIPEEVPLHDESQIRYILMEESDLNKKGSPNRVIPAIKYVEYRLPNEGDSNADTSALKNVVFIDAPGSGARTLRHLDILKQEVKKADAVILVLNTNRVDTQNAESMAFLLDNELLKEYNPTDRSRFASKVFVVVNKIDYLRGNKDGRKLLNDAVTEMCNIIDPQYLERHGEFSDNRRYFETVALLSLLASLKNQNSDKFAGDLQDVYRGKAQTLGLDPDKTSPDRIDDNTQIPMLSQYLNQFLSEQRIDLMLAEARSHLRQARDKMWDQCSDILEENGFKVQKGSFTDLQKARNFQRQDICQNLLEENKNELLQINTNLKTSMDSWQKSYQHQEALNQVITSIAQEIKKELLKQIEVLIEDRRYTATSYAKLTGSKNIEILPKIFLRKVQDIFHEIVEEKIEKLANYYLEKFESEITSQGIYQELKDKSYHQTYIDEDLNPVESMEGALNNIKFDYQSICRWVTIYELVKMPIFNSGDEDTDTQIAQDAFQKLVPELGQAITSLSIDAIRIISREMVPFPLQLFVEAVAQAAKKANSAAQNSSPDNSQTTLSSQVNAETYTQEFLDTDSLIKNINKCINKEEFKKASRLTEEQFSFRYSIAISTSILFLDRMFFYERDKYRSEFEKIAKKLIKMHQNYVGTGEDNIQSILLKKYSAKTEIVEQAFELLAMLENPSGLLSTAQA